jgi:hypothetical protein
MVNLISSITAFTKVVRVRPTFEDLDNFAATQLPLVAITAELPDPTPKDNAMNQGHPQQFISSMKISLYVYVLDNETPDTTVGNYADEIWRVLFSDPTFGSGRNALTLGIRVNPEVTVGYFDPYVVFCVNCTVRYVHTTGGI